MPELPENFMAETNENYKQRAAAFDNRGLEPSGDEDHDRQTDEALHVDALNPDRESKFEESEEPDWDAPLDTENSPEQTSESKT